MQQEAADHTQLFNELAKQLRSLEQKFQELEATKLHQAATNATLQNQINNQQEIIVNLQERIQHVEDKTTEQELNLQSTMLTLPVLDSTDVTSRVQTMEDMLIRMQDQLQDVEGIVDQLNDASTQPGAQVLIETPNKKDLEDMKE